MRHFDLQAIRFHTLLQAGTSHNLGTNFAEAFDTKYLAESGEWRHVFQTSWGMSTRMIGEPPYANEAIRTVRVSVPAYPDM